jgi:Xaa-Pro dipeptidase
MSDLIANIQYALREANLDGWLFYDFRGSDPLAARILRIDPARHMTRRWYYLIPAHGTATKILHKIEPHSLDDVPGETRLYLSWQEQHQTLKTLLGSLGKSPKIAMQYSPMNAIPYISRVDAGTLELVRSFSAKIVSSADLVQRFEAVWTAEQYASHCEAAAGLREIVDEVFAGVRRDIHDGKGITERDVQKAILASIERRGLQTYSPPIVAVNAHAADPHYSPPVTGSAPIRRGDLVLIDLWAKTKQPGSMYGDITWTGFIGENVPARQAEIFNIVAAARDAAISFVKEQVTSGRFPRGGEVDDVCRDVIKKAGYADKFIHRTGHSIGEEVHGNGANIDNLETNDARRLLPHTCFSIEPGIYLPGDFGIRSEVDVYLTENEAIVTGLPIQTAIVPVMAT